MFLDDRLGNTPRWFVTPPRDWHMNVPDVALKNVVFIGWVESSGETEQVIWDGTAFFVSVPAPSGMDFQSIYLVTVKHIADKLKLPERKWCIRINTKDGRSVLVEGDPGARWWGHPTEEESVDCAVLPYAPPDEANVDAASVPISMFATEEVIENNGIGEGDEVFVIGLFTRLAGNDRNVPIVRTGNVAMIPREPLPAAKIDSYFGPIDAYLIETRSMGGISGSPVFVRETLVFRDVSAVQKATGKTKQTVGHVSGEFYLLGINHGHWRIHPSEHNRYDFRTTSNVSESIALGISIVVPAKKILEIINHPELVEGREQAYREWTLRHGGTSTE
jgi:hypothetical protein